MKKHYLLALALVPLVVSAQLKQIAFSELTAGSGMFFGAEMTPTTITVTVQGPADRFIAFGFGSGMGTGNDAIIFSTLGTGAAPLQLRDHRMVGTGVEPTVDAQQDWSVISNDVVGSNRTIVASRALSTGDANDITFNFASNTQNLFWSKGPSATNQLQYHGASNRASGIVRNWVLVDQTPPLLNTTTPADNASGVSLTANLIMSFNEPMSWNTGAITLYDGSNNVIQTVSSGSPNVNFIGNTVSFNPTANLVINTDYYVHIDPTALEDAAGNAFAGFTDNTTWNFNTNDITAPVLAAGPFVPADETIGAALNTNLSVTFNENVQVGTGVIELFDGSNTLIESFDAATSPLISITNATVTINPTNDLTVNTDYYVHIASGAIEDVSGNAYAGISNNTTWNFNTNELVPPVAVPPFTPADNATNVATTTTFSITFSEDMVIPPTAAQAFTLHLASGTTVHAFASGDPGLSLTGSTLTVTSAAPLLEQTAYYITIDPGFITDLAGNNFAGIADQTTWNFTTGDFTAPAIATLFPADDATDVQPTVDPAITFNEPVVLGTGNIYLVNETSGETATYDVATSTFLNVTGSTVTIDPTIGLNIQDFCHILIDAGAIEDLAGNPFAGISDTTDWNFRIVLDWGIDELTAAGITWDGTTLSIDANAAPMTVNLFDASGKLVKANLGTKTNCSDLTTGVYIVTMRTGVSDKTARIYVR